MSEQSAGVRQLRVVSCQDGRDELSHRARTLACIAIMVPISMTGAPSPEPAPQAEPATTNVALDVYVAPRARELEAPVYPSAERRSGGEGWVNLNFMVSPEGKPYEVMVTQSTGSKALEQAALRAAEQWTFEPASLNGQPIEASHEVKVRFSLSEMGKGASPGFAKQYRVADSAGKYGLQVLGDPETKFELVQF